MPWFYLNEASNVSAELQADAHRQWIFKINFIRSAVQKKAFIKIDSYAKCFTHSKASHLFFFYTKTMIDISFLVSTVFHFSLRVPDALHTAVAPEIWIDQSGFSRHEKLYCPNAISLVTEKALKSRNFSHWRRHWIFTKRFIDVDPRQIKPRFLEFCIRGGRSNFNIVLTF